MLLTGVDSERTCPRPCPCSFNRQYLLNADVPVITLSAEDAAVCKAGPRSGA